MKLFSRILTLALAVAALAAGPGNAAAKIRIAASITDLASIASSVGGDQVEVFAIARPTTDPHRIEVLPSYMVQVSRANLYLKVGLGLDQWADGLIDGSRNTKLKVVDCSAGVAVLEKPSTLSASLAALGDVHPYGNPHYWLDPRNGSIVANNIAEQLGKMDPAHAADYTARAAAFAKEVDAAYARGQKLVAGLPVKTILTYHRSWVYFGAAYGLEIPAEVEPLPGIPPTAKHLSELVQIAKQRKIAIVIQEPYFSDDAPKFLAREAGLKVIKVSPSCDGPQAGSYLAHFESILKQMVGSPTSG